MPSEQLCACGKELLFVDEVERCRQCQAKKRLCGCGNVIASMSGSRFCRTCRERAEAEKKERVQKARAEASKEKGLVQFHSCISTIHDPASPMCRCRKFVTFEEAKKLVEQGLAVDFQTRTPNFLNRAVLTSSKLKRPPASSLGARIAIERKVVSHAKEYDEQDIIRMQAAVAEDASWKRMEWARKIDIEHELSEAAEEILWVIITDEEAYFKKRDESWGRPGIFAGDERTAGAIGRDIGLTTLDESIDNFDEPDCQPQTPEDEDIEAVEGDESDEGDDGEQDEDFVEAA